MAGGGAPHYTLLSLVGGGLFLVVASNLALYRWADLDLTVATTLAALTGVAVLWLLLRGNANNRQAGSA